MAAGGRRGKYGHLGADEARTLVADVLQGSSNVNLLHPWRWVRKGDVQGCPEEDLVHPGMGCLVTEQGLEV